MAEESQSFIRSQISCSDSNIAVRTNYRNSVKPNIDKNVFTNAYKLSIRIKSIPSIKKCIWKIETFWDTNGLTSDKNKLRKRGYVSSTFLIYRKDCFNMFICISTLHAYEMLFLGRGKDYSVHFPRPLRVQRAIQVMILDWDAICQAYGDWPMLSG